MTTRTTERHYAVRWRSSATSAVGNGRKFHDEETAQMWATMQDAAGKKADRHWVVDLGPCDCPEE